MHKVAATEAKTRFGHLMDQAKKEPVIIQSHGRDAAILLDIDEYRRLEEMENAIWLARAEEAEEKGYLSVEESARWLAEQLKRMEKE